MSNVRQHLGAVPALHPCPACGFLVFTEDYGSYNLCPVCDWEDDGLQLANPTSGGGANERSLAQRQVQALSLFPEQVEVANGFRRSKAWRQLSSHEIEGADSARNVAWWHTSAVLSEEEAYWKRRQ